MTILSVCDAVDTCSDQCGVHTVPHVPYSDCEGGCAVNPTAVCRFLIEKVPAPPTYPEDTKIMDVL